MIDALVGLFMVLFPVSEIALAFVRRSRGRAARRHDRGSLALIWLAVVVGLILANVVQFLPTGRLPVPDHIAKLLALGLLVSGLAIRWMAIVTLGRLFTVNVAIHSGHTVVQKGIYRLVRHPSYTGLLMAFLGLGVFTANWLAILGLMVPIGLAVANRVAREERALLGSLGPEYAAYCARTKRFIPGLF